MRLPTKHGPRGGWWNKVWSPVWLGCLAVMFFSAPGFALPNRLVLALDGVSYRDLAALQNGIAGTNRFGRAYHRQAFTTQEGYFPVSRMISTFPSVSDVAWTDIFGDRPLPGYQRTYYSIGANREVAINGVTTSTEHERQMNWQVEDSYVRLMGYLHPQQTYKYELDGFLRSFWNATNLPGNYYVYIRASDDAQHLNGNIREMLCVLDTKLQKLRNGYKVETGRDLQILILSDHGHNHAGQSRRVAVEPFLRGIGYHVSDRIADPKDVVVPTAGIEDWVEIHNAPGETENLARQLCHLGGVELVTAQDPQRDDCFFIVNPAGDRGVIQWKRTNNSFRYESEQGDPISYQPAVQLLARRHQIDADGFASADDWMAATVTNRYPMALERITRAFKNNSLNPATILISLKNGYVNAGWWVYQGSRLVSCGSTHGGLDDLNSDGIVLSNFGATEDTCSDRVAGQFGGFPGVRNFRREESGGEFVSKSEQAQARIVRDPLDTGWRALSDGETCLRMWSPEFLNRDRAFPVAVVIERIPRFANAEVCRGGRRAGRYDPIQQITLSDPIQFPQKSDHERIYEFPESVSLDRQAQYLISGKIHVIGNFIKLFTFRFNTDNRGRPLAY